MDVLVIVPTYNEAQTLPGTLARLRAAVPAAQVLVVDDGSPDGTADLAAELGRRDDHIHLMRRTAKEGLGPAYRAGFRWGLERGAGLLVEMDADASHRPEQLPRLLTAAGPLDQDGPELVIGSRYVPGGDVHDWSRRRELLSRGANLYVRLLTGLPVADSTAGFRAYRAALLERLLEQDVASQGYCFQIDMTRRARRAGARIVEVPIDFDERTEGASKMTGRIVREALVDVAVWGVQDRSRQLRESLRRRRGRSIR
ncbi:polyprenol monophosphomannose synthase [Brachybacterium sp. EF45031]|nr:polyprenol monophosphomannose synthase [Brachybacterium sillae]